VVSQLAQRTKLSGRRNGDDVQFAALSGGTETQIQFCGFGQAEEAPRSEADESPGLTIVFAACIPSQAWDVAHWHFSEPARGIKSGVTSLTVPSIGTVKAGSGINLGRTA
jgi:hypothetical protein